MSERMRRVNESVRQVLAEALPELKDPRIGLVTITGVDTSPDLRHAVVYVSVLGSLRKRNATLEGLEAAHGLLQGRLARELRMKRTPQVTVEYDPSVDRLGPDPEIVKRARRVINIDHHHDNSRFGDLDLVVADASSTGEVLRDVFRALDVALTPEIAEPLYIALVTDTGRFQYANTTPKALRLAAELVEAGADVHEVFQQVYESVEFAKLKLLARALERARVLEGGRIVVSNLRRSDFAEVGAAGSYSEGIIDYLRAVEGAELAVLIREPPANEEPTKRISLRASVDELDVSAIAHLFGGGGHRQAAGFSSDASVDGRSGGRGRRDARSAGRGCAGGTARAPPRRDRAADPGRLGGEDRRRARVPACAARRRGGDAAAALDGARARRHRVYR